MTGASSSRTAGTVSGSQMNAFELVDGRLRQVAISDRKDLGGIQADLDRPAQRHQGRAGYVGEHYGLELPDPGDAMDLEVSSRFHIVENDEIHLHSNFLLDREGDSRSVPVAFILHEGILFSVRDEELPVFRLQRRRAAPSRAMSPTATTCCSTSMAPTSSIPPTRWKTSTPRSGKVGRKVLSEKISDDEAAAILADIAEEEDLNGRIRSNILDTQRALSFLIRCRILSPTQLEDARQILRDIESLNSHTAFLFDKINFLMDATVGFININQNKRVYQLTAFGVVFMPINILAGIGGMSEFSMMTQGIPWPMAYGSFIVAHGADRLGDLCRAEEV